VYLDELKLAAKRNPKFKFTIWDSDTSGYLTADKLGLDNYVNKGYLICGPEALKKNLTHQLKAKGVSVDNIYDEEFAFR
jgi:predicted ferric reductase